MDDQLTGQMLAQYKIEGKIGQGGMGAVYRAWDTLLRRQVAIKILEAGSGQSGEKRARFLMEARAVAALNHPNIVTIYEIGQSEAVDYIAMEFVPGRTLRVLIQDGPPMVLDEVLSAAIQVADAVAAAHAAGITHRDLKPANIMVSDRGRLKVLDFGIAKRADHLEESDDTRTLEARTQRGYAVGTPHYMSPEQAQGKPVDGRSDIFAFGAILFEMLTGRLAFPGDSMAATMVSILTMDPPPVSTIRPVPEELDRLILRCLRKDVDRRIQHAGDLKLALEELRTEFGASPAYAGVSWTVAHTGALTASMAHTATATHAQQQPSKAAATVSPLPAAVAPPKSKLPWLAAGSCLVAALGFLGGWWLFRKEAPANPFDQARLSRLTADTGLSVWPTLSRDGKFLAYASDRPDEKNLHIWVRQLSGGGHPIRITSGPADDTEPSFSPDGTSIAFRSDRDGGGIYVAPTLGGEARLVAKHGRGPKFSPDGTKIAYYVGSSATFLGKIYVVNASGGSPAQRLWPDIQMAKCPIWSPDGKFILFEGGLSSAGDQNREWWIAPLAGGPARATGSFKHLREFGILPDPPSAWLPGDRLLFSGRHRMSVLSLWTLKISRAGRPEGAPRRLTFGTMTDQHPAGTGETPETHRVAFSSISKSSGLWVLPLNSDQGAVTGPMSRLSPGPGTQDQLTMSIDGRRIAFLSDRDGKVQSWIRDLRTGRETSITDPNPVWAPHISPDGKSLAWSIYENRKQGRTFRASIGPEGQPGLTELLCQDCGTIMSWSPDARSVVFNKPNPSRAVLLELETGARYDLLGKPGGDVWGGRFSPDGKWLLMNFVTSEVHSRIYIAPFDPARRGPVPFSEWIPVTDGEGWDDKPRWSPDSNSIYFISERDGFRCIWRQSLDRVSRRPAGPPQEVAHFHQARLSMRNVEMGPLAFQVGQDKLIFSLGEITGNVWMLLPGGAAAN